MGHSEVERPHPVPRNELGKLPYDVRLRAQERRRRMQYDHTGYEYFVNLIIFSENCYVFLETDVLFYLGYVSKNLF